MESSETIACPECGQSQEVRIWHSVNVSVDPGLKQELREGKINWFSCQSCEFESFIPVALLYHDMELQYCVQLIPFDQAMEKEFLKHYDTDGSFKAGGVLGSDLAPYMANQHIVFNMGELIQYVLFREKLAEFHSGKD